MPCSTSPDSSERTSPTMSSSCATWSSSRTIDDGSDGRRSGRRSSRSVTEADRRMTYDIVLYTEGPEFNGDALETGPLGGSETAFISLGRALVDAGHRVTAYCRCPRPG